jgi:hypothetical protein
MQYDRQKINVLFRKTSKLVTKIFIGLSENSQFTSKIVENNLEWGIIGVLIVCVIEIDFRFDKKRRII